MNEQDERDALDHQAELEEQEWAIYIETMLKNDPAYLEWLSKYERETQLAQEK